MNRAYKNKHKLLTKYPFFRQEPKRMVESLSELNHEGCFSAKTAETFVSIKMGLHSEALRELWNAQSGFLTPLKGARRVAQRAMHLRATVIVVLVSWVCFPYSPQNECERWKEDGWVRVFSKEQMNKSEYWSCRKGYIQTDRQTDRHKYTRTHTHTHSHARTHASAVGSCGRRN